MKPILDTLKRIEVGGITVESVRGRGRSALPAVRGLRGSAKFVAIFNSRNLIYTIVNDDKVEMIIKAIRDVVQTVDQGVYGKLFITPVEDALDLSTGIRGDNTI